VLAQLSAAAFGTGWPFYVSNLAVTLVLALAANTSFGGLPVLFNLLGHDHRMPHLSPCAGSGRCFGSASGAGGVGSPRVVHRQCRHERLLPVFAIGVFIGFTISQVGLVRHWIRQPDAPHRVAKAILNGFGAMLSAVAPLCSLPASLPKAHGCC